MLELFVLKWLMSQEGRDTQTGGVMLGYSVSYIQKKYKIPKGTFYRAVNRLIAEGFIEKQQRNQYVCSDKFRVLANEMKDGNRVTSRRSGSQL